MDNDLSVIEWVIPTQDDVFRTRRERAAQVWHNVPKCVFDMSNWECGHKCCALGWLASEEFDGWSFGNYSSRGRDRGRIPVAPNGLESYIGAARYFGISIAQATACFGDGKPTARFHHRWFERWITPTDVAKSLLALPYQKYSGD